MTCSGRRFSTRSTRAEAIDRIDRAGSGARKQRARHPAGRTTVEQPVIDREFVRDLEADAREQAIEIGARSDAVNPASFAR